jgi:hypothetical protein
MPDKSPKNTQKKANQKKAGAAAKKSATTK